MKLTLEKAVNLFVAAKAIDYNEVKIDKINLIWVELLRYAKMWDDAMMEVEKDREKVSKPFVEEYQQLSEEEKKVKGPELQKKLEEKLSGLTSVKAQAELMKKEFDVDLPTLTKDELVAISKSKAFKNIGESGIFYDLLEG